MTRNNGRGGANNDEEWRKSGGRGVKDD